MIGRAQLSEVEGPLEDVVDSPPSLEIIVDELMIRRVVDEIDNACDAKDWRRCRSFFADDIDVDFTSLTGGEPARIKADALINAWRTNLFAEKKSFHQRTNHLIKIEGENATVFSKGYAFNLLETGEVIGLWEVWGEYTHTLKKSNNAWKVTGMILKVAYKRGDDRVRNFVPENQ